MHASAFLLPLYTATRFCFGISDVHIEQYILTVIYDRDSNKNSKNLEKHGISLEYAQEIFLDLYICRVLTGVFPALRSVGSTLFGKEQSSLKVFYN